MLLKADVLVCTKCKETKPESEFYNNRTMKRGKTYWCKVCSNYQSNFIQKESKALWSARTHQNRRRNNTPYYLWRMAKRRAKDLHREFNIEIDDIIIPEACPYTGQPFSFDNRDYAPSLDRIDSSKGYIKGNIQVISLYANMLKSDLTPDQLIRFAKGVLAVHSKEGRCCAA